MTCIRCGGSMYLDDSDPSVLEFVCHTCARRVRVNPQEQRGRVPSDE